MTIILTNVKDSYDYIIQGIQDWNGNKFESSLDFNLPDGGPSDVSVIRLEGQKESLTITFYLFPRSADASNGTANGVGGYTTITSVADQEAWLKDYIYSKDFDASWTLTDGERYSSEPVTIKNIGVRKIVGTPNGRVCTMAISWGSNILA